MNSEFGGPSSNDQRRRDAADLARKKVLAIYSAAAKKINGAANYPITQNFADPSSNPSNSLNSFQNPTSLTYDNSAPSVSTNSNQSLSEYSTTDYQAPVEPQPTFYQRYDSDASADNNTSTQTQNYYAQSDFYAPSSYQNYQFHDQEPNATTSSIDNSSSLYQNSHIPDSSAYSTSTYQAESVPSSSSTSYNQTYSNAPTAPSATLKDVPVNQATNDELAKYHSAWQNYYQKYYNDYYSKAAQTYLATAKLQDQRAASGKIRQAKRARHLAPLFIIGAVILTFLFLQYNRLIFAPIMAYISPDTGNVTTSLEAVDPNLNQPVSPEPRLIIPKLNVDVPIAFDVAFDDVMEAMDHGVAHYAIPGANALPGQVGNFVITGHSAGDVYSNLPYKFIFSGLERLTEGDLIYVNYNSVRYTYQMTKREVVEPSNVAALIYPTDKPMITLITCTPLGTSKYRLLITGKQISPDYEPATPAETDPENPTTPEEPNKEISMPANEPSFFERIWNWLTGK